MTLTQEDTRRVGLNAARRPRALGWWYVAEQRIRGMRSYLVTWIALGLASPFLYVAGLGFGLSVIVNQSQGGQQVAGLGYIAFVAPALLLGAAMQTGSQESVYGVFGGFKWTPIFLAMRQSPVSPTQIVIGYNIGTLTRVLPLSFVYVLVLWLFGVTGSIRVLWLIPIAAVLVLSVALPVMAWSASQTQDRGQLNFIDRFIMLPLMLFSGTYYPLDTLPVGLHWIGWVSPLWHAVDLSRWAVYGMPVPGWLLIVHVVVLATFATVGFLLSRRIFIRRLDS
ncbi:MAG: ABC transporter permease [Microbacterium sp.]